MGSSTGFQAVGHRWVPTIIRSGCSITLPCKSVKQLTVAVLKGGFILDFTRLNCFYDIDVEQNFIIDQHVVWWNREFQTTPLLAMKLGTPGGINKL